MSRLPLLPETIQGRGQKTEHEVEEQEKQRAGCRRWRLQGAKGKERKEEQARAKESVTMPESTQTGCKRGTPVEACVGAGGHRAGGGCRLAAARVAPSSATGR